MYSKTFTAKKVREAGAKLGFSLTPHTTQQIDEQTKRLAEIVGDDRRLVRPLRDDEKQFILNERVLSKLDFRYWSSRYYWIMHFEAGRIVRFSPNIAQNILLDVWGELEEKQLAIMIQILKARQLGMTTATEGAVAHRTQFYKHTNGLIASSDPDKSRKMAGMTDRCYANQPWWLRPDMTSYRAGELMEFDSLDSGISIQHGAQFTGLGRGSTPNVAHLSEVAEFIEPEELIDASLINAMHPSPGMFLVLESTAKGRKNYWHRMWVQCKENYASGKASFYPMFLPWFVGRDIYPTDTWMRQHPLPQEYEPSTLTYHHSERAKAYVNQNDLLRKYLGEEWEMPVEQMWWWEVTRDEYKAKDILNKFYEEMPADDLEAFQSTNRSAFSADILSVYRENTQAPIGVFGFYGKPDEIPSRMWPDNRDIDRNLPPITIKSHWSLSGQSSTCQLVPLKFQGYPSLDPMGKLLVWEMPEDGEQYGVGIDTGDGVGLDRTTMEVLRKGTFERNDAQVAEFMSPYVGASEFWPLSLAIGTLYSTVVNEGLKQSRVVIDCLKNGETIQLEMKKRGWWHFHDWLRYDKKRLRIKDSHRHGWFSNSWSRSMMFDYIIRALKDDWVDIASPYFVDEMGDLERDDMRQSLKAVYGGHDDLFVSMGMVFFSLHILETRGAETPIAAARSAQRQLDTIDPVFHPGFQATDFGPREFQTRDELLESYEEETW
jgi:hypothetical protein